MIKKGLFLQYQYANPVYVAAFSLVHVKLLYSTLGWSVHLTRFQSLVFLEFASWDVNNFLVGSNCSQHRKSLFILLASVGLHSAGMVSFVLYGMLFGVLVFCPETGEIGYLCYSMCLLN